MLIVMPCQLGPRAAWPPQSRVTRSTAWFLGHPRVSCGVAWSLLGSLHLSDQERLGRP
jgi:hypothetical protein